MGIEQRARGYIAAFRQGEPSQQLLRLAMAHQHVGEAAELCAQAGDRLFTHQEVRLAGAATRDGFDPYRDASELAVRLGDAVRTLCAEPTAQVAAPKG